MSQGSKSSSEGDSSEAYCRAFRTSLAAARDPNLAKLAAARRAAQEEESRIRGREEARAVAEREAKAKKEAETNKDNFPSWMTVCLLKPPPLSSPFLETRLVGKGMCSLSKSLSCFIYEILQQFPSHNPSFFFSLSLSFSSSSTPESLFPRPRPSLRPGAVQVQAVLLLFE